MALPRPQPGLVIHYNYLWRHDHVSGRDTGSKTRPCAIIVALADKAGLVETVVAPITHRQPIEPAEGVEIPYKVKRHLGLDDQRSWVIVTDLNLFIWPGVDLSPVPNRAPGTFDYGLLPPALFERIRSRIVDLGTIEMATKRTE